MAVLYSTKTTEAGTADYRTKLFFYYGKENDYENNQKIHGRRIGSSVIPYSTVFSGSDTGSDAQIKSKIYDNKGRRI